MLLAPIGRIKGKGCGSVDPVRPVLPFLSLLLACSGQAWGQASTPVGLWETVSDRTGQADGMVRIVAVDDEYVGTVVAVISPPAKSANPLCEKCKGELKDKPIVGMTILRGVKRLPDGWSNGEILDPDDGKVYKCRLTLIDGGAKLEVRGYIGIPLLGRTQTWSRKE